MDKMLCRCLTVVRGKKILIYSNKNVYSAFLFQSAGGNCLLYAHDNPISIQIHMQLSEINPLSKVKSQLVASLSQKKMRTRYGLFTVEGRKGVEDLLRYGSQYPLEMLVMSNPDELVVQSDAIAGCIELAEPSLRQTTPLIASVTDSEMKKLTSLSTPSEVIGVFRMQDEGKRDLRCLPPELYLILDGVQDPGNMGTIIRTCHWFGIRRIFASTDTVDLYNPKTIQSTMGSLGAVEVVYTDLCRLIDDNPDIPVVGLLLEGESIYATPLPETAFIAMGNEGKGLSRPVRERISLGLTIPPYDSGHHPESLNVAIATAITLSQFRK
ncbi:MAG: RNA methyltransferase [Bacteroides sp.]|nr:RNA methyltransferase [Bacteroides sp.]